MTFDFYKRLMNKKNPSNELIPLKNFYIDKNLEIKKIIKKLYFDFYSVFYIYEDKVFAAQYQILLKKILKAKIA